MLINAHLGYMVFLDSANNVTKLIEMELLNALLMNLEK